MIEMKLTVSEVDYESLARLLAGSLGGAAAVAARALPESAKEEMAVKYMNANAGKLAQSLERMAENKGVHVHITGAQAKVL